MFENTKAILHSIVEGKSPRKGSKTYGMVDSALSEVFFANQKLKEAEAKIIELNNAVSSLLLDDHKKEKKIRAFENADVTDNVIFVWDKTSSFIEEIQLSDERIALDIKKHYKVYIVEEVENGTK